MRIDLTVHDRDGRCRDVAVTAPAGSALRDVATRLAVLVGGEEEAGEWWSGLRRLPATALLGDPGLRTGDVLTTDAAAARDPSAGAVLRLQVVGGPDAGQVVALPRGMLTIGRAADCDLVLTDPDVSRQHACITVTAGGITVRDLGSTNGTALDGANVDEDGTALPVGAVLRLGDSFLSVGRFDQPLAALRPGAGGALLVNRPPRASTLLSRRAIDFPARDGARTVQRVQWIAALLPAAAGVGLAVALHSAQFLAFALLSPVIVLATSLGDRLHWRRGRRRDAASWGRRETKARAEALAALTLETAQRRAAHPDPVLLRDIALAPGPRLWERRRADSDALSVRLGLTDLPSALQARRGTTLVPAGRVHDVPATVDLRAGALGIAAPTGIELAIARWLVCQLAVLHSPADLQLAMLLSPGAASSWAWSRWLPHLTRSPATTPDERQALVADLGVLVEQRSAGRPDPAGWSGPWLVLIVDRAGELSDQLGLSALLTAGAAVGITAICIDGRVESLPAAGTLSAIAVGETGARLEISYPGASEPGAAVADRVTAQWAESVARALAPIADTGGGVSSALPQQCRLLDLLEIAEFDAPALDERWQRSDGRAGTVLGMGVDGPVAIDLVRDGPHALVAGTTGAGKSELLQALVAGLAVHHPPDAISFVLIDYKGGAAFADCADLPHVAGLVTDLDAQLTERALRSLHCELNRREAMFAQVGAADLIAYRALGPAGAKLARLILVVDEFAALAEELPDFVTGLIAIAQRGRSLGVHLVLATQRPGGVVSPEIRANTTLRVALRMSDPAESYDVIGTERAAQLGRDTPGRAILRVGTGMTDLQTGRVSGPARIGSSTEITVTPLGPWRSLPDPGADDAGISDLQLLVGALRAAATASGRARPGRPWLSPLPIQLSTAQLPRAADRTSIAFGLIDRPDRQLQTPFLLDLAAGGSVLFTGAPRSGRTSALLTIALVAAQQLERDELAIYSLDCAGGGLASIGRLPQCGTAAARDDVDLVMRLLDRLEAEVHRRQTWLAERDFSSVAEARSQGQRVALMLLLLDGWDAFVAITEEHDGGRAAETLLRLLRAAAAAGLTIALAGDRTTLSARLAGAVATKLVLNLADRADYAMAGIPARAVPRELPPGRAIRTSDAAEVQLAFVGPAPSGAERERTIATIRTRTVAGPGVEGAEHRPIRLRPLPSRICLSQLPALPGLFTIGAAGDAAKALSVDLFAGAGRLLVAGPPRSGRSTALATLLVQAIRVGVTVVLAARRGTLLARTADAHGVAVLGPDSAAAEAAVPDDERTLLLVDDSEAFLDTPVGDALATHVRGAPAGLAAVVAANSDDLPLTYRGLAAEVRRSRCALVLQPGPGDGDLVGRRILQRRAVTAPGRGLVVADAAWGDRLAAQPVPVQVALP
jgi:DNA segregation ATPase FtsK/SpoIIIE, S-DNA-T family